MESRSSRRELPADIMEALSRKGLPIPSPDRVTRLGYSAREVMAIESYRTAVAGAAKRAQAKEEAT